MKNIKVITFLCAITTSFFFSSCERDLETEGISRITNFAEFQMAGDQFMSLVVGSTFTDPGVKATEGGNEIPVTASGTVNTATPGLYQITYSATNSDDFSASTSRTVAVLAQAEKPGVNIAGAYKNTGSFNYTSNVVKLAPGLYRSPNVWGGGSAAVIPAYIITTDGVNLTLPVSTLSPYGRVQGMGTLNPAGLMTLSVSLLDQGLSNSTRTWQKQ